MVRQDHPLRRSPLRYLLRLLDAEADGADWQEAAQIVLHRDPVAEPERSRHCWEDHLRRAKWMTKTGYRKILSGDRDTLQRSRFRDTHPVATTLLS